MTKVVPVACLFLFLMWGHGQSTPSSVLPGERRLQAKVDTHVQLRELERAQRIFDLRRALNVSDDDEDLFYRAVVAARFGQDAVAISQLRRVLETHPDREMERKAHEELASVLMRASRYGDSASEYAAVLRLMRADDPDRADIEEKLAVCDSLRGAPTQTVEFSKAATVKTRLLGSWIVPLSVNGKDADWILDTGANLSLVTESEAARLGLTILPESAIASGSTGKRNRVRVAIGTDVRFGSALLHNVAIVVIADNALPRQAPRGILGLPAIRSLGKISISSKGVVLIEPDSRIPPGEPNIFFEGLTPIVEAHHGSSPIQMVVDTGASRTTFYANFRATLSQEEIGQLRKSKAKSTGVGETTERPVEIAAKLQLEMPGRHVALKDAALRSEQPREFGYEHGLIGMDLLVGGFTLDFRAMQLQFN